MVDVFTSIIAKIIAKHKKISLAQLFEEYNELVFRGDALCTNWGVHRVNGREMLYCASIDYVLEHLESAGAIKISDGDEDKVVEVMNPDALKQFMR